MEGLGRPYSRLCESPAARKRRSLGLPKPPASEENNKPAKSLRQRLEEAGIEVLPSEHPTREVFTEESLEALGFKVPPRRGEVTRESLEALGFELLTPRGQGFVIGSGGPIRKA